MTIDQFIINLRNRTKRLGIVWYFRGTAIRCKNDDCPITSIFQTGDPSRWVDCAIRLGMDMEEARKIVSAADWSNKYPDIRKRLIKACGIEVLT